MALPFNHVTRPCFSNKSTSTAGGARKFSCGKGFCYRESFRLPREEQRTALVSENIEFAQRVRWRVGRSAVSPKLWGLKRLPVRSEGIRRQVTH